MHKNVKCECHFSDFSHQIASYCITIISSNILHARWQKSVRHPRHVSSHVHTLIPHISIYWNCIKVQFPLYQETSNISDSVPHRKWRCIKISQGSSFFAWLLTFLISHHFWRLLLTVTRKVSLTALYSTMLHLNDKIW